MKQRPHLHFQHLASCSCGKGPDGHKRITQAQDFTINGGTAEGHERMTEATIKAGEELAKKGKSLTSASLEERADALRNNYPR